MDNVCESEPALDCVAARVAGAVALPAAFSALARLPRCIALASNGFALGVAGTLPSAASGAVFSACPTLITKGGSMLFRLASVR